MNGIAEYVDKVTTPAPLSRAQRRHQEQAQARNTRNQRRSRARIQKALAAYPTEGTA